MADPQTPNPADEADALALPEAAIEAFARKQYRDYDVMSVVGRHYAREEAVELLTAAAPHLTGPLEAEAEALRAELADYSEQYGEQREALNRERTRMTAVVDAITSGTTDLVGAVTGEEVKDRAGEIVRGLGAEVARLRAENERLAGGLRSCEHLLPYGHEDAQTCDQPCHPSTDRCPQHDPHHLDYIDGLRGEITCLRDALQGRDVNERGLVEEITRLRAERDEMADTLGEIWLYVSWRYVTKQLATERKELWADAVDRFGEPGPKADRWWRDDAPAPAHPAVLAVTPAPTTTTEERQA